MGCETEISAYMPFPKDEKSVLGGIFVGVMEITFEQPAFPTPTLNISSGSLILLLKKSQDANVSLITKMNIRINRSLFCLWLFDEAFIGFYYIKSNYRMITE